MGHLKIHYKSQKQQIALKLDTIVDKTPIYLPNQKLPKALHIFL